MGANILRVSSELDQYLSEPLFAQNYCKIDAPAVMYRHVRADLQISMFYSK